MLQFQLTSNMSSLSLSEKHKNGYPFFVSTKDMKLGLSTFWKSPYLNGTNIGNKKRELPIVVPPRLCSRQSVRTNRSATRSVRGILKNPKADSNSDGSLTRKLRRTNSLTAKSTDQVTKKVQFGEFEQKKTNKHLDIQNEHSNPDEGIDTKKNIPQGESLNRTECADDLALETKKKDKPEIEPRPTTAIGLVTDYESKDSKQMSGQPVPPRVACTTTLRTPRLLRRSNTSATINVSNTNKSTRNSTVIRPKSCIGGRSAMLSNHTNFCNRDTTIRILKWLKEVDDVQFREGKCTELINDVPSTELQT